MCTDDCQLALIIDTLGNDFKYSSTEHIFSLVVSPFSLCVKCYDDCQLDSSLL